MCSLVVVEKLFSVRFDVVSRKVVLLYASEFITRNVDCTCKHGQVQTSMKLEPLSLIIALESSIRFHG